MSFRRVGSRLSLIARSLAAPCLVVGGLVTTARAQSVAWPYYVKTWFANAGAQIVNPTGIVFGPRGEAWVPSQGGHIFMLRDANQDGVIAPGEVTQFTTNPQAAAHPNALGLCFVGGDLWVSSTTSTGAQAQIGVYRDTNLDLMPDNTFAVRITGPTVGQHQNNQMTLGPDGLIYLGIGSIANTSAGSALNAVIARFDPAVATPTLSVFANGLRNCFDVCFDAAGNLFGTDNGRDDLGNVQPPEELNHVVSGADYGFPAELSTRTPPIATFAAHSSPVGLVAYNHPRFPGVAGELLVMTYKPNFAQLQVGRTLSRVHLTPNGGTFTATVTPLVTGFGSASSGVSSCLDLAVDAIGDVYMLEYSTVPILAPERILKLSHPFLAVEGSGAIGTNLTLLSYGRENDLQVTLFGRPAAAPIPVPPFGDFGIDPGLILYLDSGAFPATDVFGRQLPIPNDPALRGARLAFQTFVVNGLNPAQGVLTNASTVTIN